MRHALSAFFFAALASAALAQAPPPIPPIADANRVQTYNISSSTPQVAVGFPVFGDCTDLQVTIAGTVYPSPSSLWNCASPSGALNALPLPITDMVVNFTPPLTSGTLTIQGAWHPRNLTVPTAPGISRREYEQAVSTLIAAQRELFYDYGGLLAAGITSLSPQFDSQFGSAQGDILYRGATSWTALTPGTSGQVLTTLGAGTNPLWQSISGVGTVTNIATGTGLTGGAITSSGTISLAAASNNTVKSNISGGSAAPIDNTPSAIIDSAIGNVQGDLLYRGASAWNALAPGTAGQFLQSGGAAANPSWVSSVFTPPTAIALGGVFSSSASAGNVATGIDTSGNVVYSSAPYGAINAGTVLSNITGASAAPIGNTMSALMDSALGNAQGNILYRSGAGWTVLAPGTAGKVLTTQGASANPSWVAVVGTGTVTSVATGTGLTGGTITTTGTISLANSTDATIHSNISGGSAPDIDNNISSIFDYTLGSTQGSVLMRGPSAWAVLGPGLSGQVLTTNGGGQNPSWASGTGRVLLNTLTASNSASVSDITSLTSTYSEYDLVFTNVVPASSPVACLLRVHSGGIFPTTSYSASGSRADVAGVASLGSLTTYIPCASANVFNGAPGISGTIHVSNPSGTSAAKQWYGIFTSPAATNGPAIDTVGGYWSNNAAVDGFSVFFSSGNITSGTIKVYGATN